LSIQEAEDDKTKLITPPKLKLITGGKGPVDPPGHNWLADLDTGTVFLGKMRKMDTFELTQYRIKFKFIKSALLGALLPERMVEFYVDMKQFSKDIELIEIIGLIGPEDDSTTDQSE
jgi:hypothetical protein